MLQVGLVANTKTFASAAASVAGGIGSAVLSTAGCVVRCGMGGGAAAAGQMAPAGVLGMVGGFAVGSVVGAATGLLTNVPSAYRSVRGGFGLAAGAYAEHEAECAPNLIVLAESASCVCVCVRVCARVCVRVCTQVHTYLFTLMQLIHPLILQIPQGARSRRRRRRCRQPHAAAGGPMCCCSCTAALCFRRRYGGCGRCRLCAVAGYYRESCGGA